MQRTVQRIVDILVIADLADVPILVARHIGTHIHHDDGDVVAAAGAKSVKLEDPTRTISRNHAAISFDQDGTLWIEDYGSLNGTYIIQDDVETKVEHKPMQLEAPCTVRIGDQFFQFRKQ